MSDIEFVDGLIFKLPHENAPDFVKGKLSIKRKELGNWLRGKEEEWINIDLKVSREGKAYASVDTWKPDSNVRSDTPADNSGEESRVDNSFDDTIPF